MRDQSDYRPGDEKDSRSPDYDDGPWEEAHKVLEEELGRDPTEQELQEKVDDMESAKEWAEVDYELDKMDDFRY